MSLPEIRTKDVIERLYKFGPTLRDVVQRFNQLPEQEVIKGIEGFYRYLGEVDPKIVSSRIEEMEMAYKRIPGIAKSIAGISDVADRRIRELFTNTELMVSMLAARFYQDGKLKQRDFTSREEHQEWVRKFRGYLEEELKLLLEIYPKIRESGIIMGKVRGALKPYGREAFLDKLPSNDDMREMRAKILRVYDLFEKEQAAKYN